MEVLLCITPLPLSHSTLERGGHTVSIDTKALGVRCKVVLKRQPRCQRQCPFHPAPIDSSTCRSKRGSSQDYRRAPQILSEYTDCTSSQSTAVLTHVIRLSINTSGGDAKVKAQLLIPQDV